VEFSYVDRTAEALVLLMHREALRNETFHLHNPENSLLSDVLPDESLKLNLQTATPAAFIDHLLAHYGKPGFQPHIESILLHFGWMDAEEKAEPTEFIHWSDRTDALLARLGFSWPALAPASLSEMVAHALKERTDFLQKIDLFADLDEGSRAAIAAQAQMKLVEEGAALLWEGEVNDYLYVIQEGQLEITLASEAGWQGVLRILSAMDHFGEEGLFDQAPSQVVAKAIHGEARVLAIPITFIRDLLALHPTLAMTLLRSKHKQLRSMERIMATLG
jgi:hypothetical protein